MRRRIIPVLLLDSERRLVKTVGFGERTYIGDPFNVVRLFNEREVDELCLLDIDASRHNRAPDLDFLGKFASECFMPVAYGGGISSLEQCHALNRLGFEKYVVSCHAEAPGFISALVEDFGTQALATVIDYSGSGEQARTRSGKRPVEVARQRAAAGFGEIILQSIDRDGLRQGFDLETIRAASVSVSVPIIALGGAGEREHFRPALLAGASAAASGSAFSFIGRRRAVLVNYPSQAELDQIAGDVP